MSMHAEVDPYRDPYVSPIMTWPSKSGNQFRFNDAPHYAATRWSAKDRNNITQDKNTVMKASRRAAG
ncbi:hypothetical protein VTG60DRAFT_6619 [Thermothelomyces hinnuleus]